MLKWCRLQCYRGTDQMSEIFWFKSIPRSYKVSWNLVVKNRTFRKYGPRTYWPFAVYFYSTDEAFFEADRTLRKYCLNRDTVICLEVTKRQLWIGPCGRGLLAFKMGWIALLIILLLHLTKEKVIIEEFLWASHESNHFSFLLGLKHAYI